MIYLQLFLNFLMIGALSFGGGYGMISLVRETVLRYGAIQTCVPYIDKIL